MEVVRRILLVFILIGFDDHERALPLLHHVPLLVVAQLRLVQCQWLIMILLGVLLKRRVVDKVLAGRLLHTLLNLLYHE